MREALILAQKFFLLLIVPTFLVATACDERRKSDAELGLTPRQSAGRRVYDDQCDRCHEPYSSKGKKGPSLSVSVLRNALNASAVTFATKNPSHDYFLSIIPTVLVPVARVLETLSILIWIW